LFISNTSIYIYSLLFEETLKPLSSFDVINSRCTCSPAHKTTSKNSMNYDAIGQCFHCRSHQRENQPIGIEDTINDHHVIGSIPETKIPVGIAIKRVKRQTDNGLSSSLPGSWAPYSSAMYTDRYRARQLESVPIQQRPLPPLPPTY
jgi:hypothetical protein